MSLVILLLIRFFFYNVPSPSEFYTLSLHDALPICVVPVLPGGLGRGDPVLRAHCGNDHGERRPARRRGDRKSTRLNSSHVAISYAVFCLKKKNNTQRR